MQYVPDRFSYPEQGPPWGQLEVMRRRIKDAAQVSESSRCSRQYINDLVKKGQLHPVKCESENTLFLKREIEEKLW